MIKVQVMRFNQGCEANFDAHFLCATDRKMFSQMQSPVRRKRFLVTRKMLYRALSEKTGLDQSALSIGTGLFGKPYLENSPQFIDFSLSHCREFLAIATSFGEHVGIDIEDRSLRGQAPELSAVCSTDELQWLSTSSEVDFLELWTKKEAFLKLNGVGLSINPKEVEVARGYSVLYSGKEPLLYSHANVLMHKSDQHYVLSVAYPTSKDAEVTIEFIDEDCLLES